LGDGDENELADMGEGNELEGGGGMTLLIGGAKDGAAGLAPRARAAAEIGLGVVGSDCVEIGWGS
jgi:hypothetical protein